MQRRKFLKLAGTTAIAPWLLLSAPGTAQEKTTTRTVTVLTSFPEAMVLRIEQAFSAAHPDIRLEILWRSGRDAYQYLQTADAAATDVYWAPARFNFFTLAAEDRFLPLRVDQQALPGRIGLQQQSDPQNRYVAVETAAYVLVVNEDYLRQHRLPTPQRFQDLGDPRYAGHIALPVPSRIGFAPPIYEHWLQTYGWQAGFELMFRAAANANLIGSGGTGVVEQVGGGAAGVGLSMDFFAHNAGAQGLRLGMHYPADTLFSPAHLGIFKSSAHLREAHAFMDFILSDAGQQLLLEPSIGRLPMRSSVYRHAGRAPFNPYSMAGQAVAHDPGLGLQRQPIVSALFDAACTDRHAQLKKLWQQLHAAGQQGTVAAEIVAQARALATQTPVDEQQAGSKELSTLLSLPSTTRSTQRERLLSEWAAFYERNYAAALALLDQETHS